MPDAHILVVGSANVDLIMKLSRLPAVGETVSGGIFMQTFGGKGANQAYAAALSGAAAHVAFVACVGDDALGAQVSDNMRAAGVDVSRIFVAPGVATGTALIMIGEAGRNMIAVAPGANYTLGAQQLDLAQDMIAAADLVVMQCELNPEATADLLRRCARAGRKVMFNLAPARALDAALLRHIAYLLVNETEAAFLTGGQVDSDAQIHAAAHKLLAQGAGAVIITLGSRGAFVQARGAAGSLAPGFQVEAIDSTAAGDTFAGALAVALLEGAPLLDAARFANAAAAISVTRLGAQSSVPTRVEIDAFLRDRR